ncbi:MAG TPA: DUF309 domain-containing protein [Candidatus Kryptonia bacterium]|nr:DUF309 domain-containing protein [Candidatus Kryptonia bacterium]
MSDIPDPPNAAARYTSRPFPAYRYVPGLRPHPTRDPRGHSYEATPRLNRHAPWRPDEWRTLEAWLYGIDLFNARYFWEAHEAWEGLWATAPTNSAPALLLQGLIQIAAALLKNHMGVIEGVRVLSREGIDKLRQVSAELPQLMGVDVVVAVAAFERYFAPAAKGLLPILDEVPQLECSASPPAEGR